jgi:hypothetical protein
MSTPLERMILRTRAPLSSLEPLAEPRYARAAQAGSLPWEPQSPDPLSAGITEATAEPGGAGDPGQGMGPAARWQPRARPHARDDIDAGDAQPRPTRAHSAPRSSAPPSAAPATRMGRDSGESIVRDPGQMPGPQPGGQPVAVSVRVLPTSPPAPASAGRPAPQALQTPAGAEATPPEVTISIGHIEVRSPPATVQRPKPVFRPQVSLAEFLGRRQGGRP